ncbi:general secretion pathway protein B [Shewanella sp. MR-4]|uniref:general secretion pathway protein GspB n=1 Tax=Shewanella sp. (strain MR-4) TaxID=60480 RepID=UPI00005E4D5E|nr:general secretion pathway protein GspB [Shewanella sp. MR-4]ABI39966.1 general secretion pathway protein B [Shewanella sp. MR-4]
MSILLDAVTRNKQQQTSPLPDAVLTPRASYPSARKSAFPVAKLSLLAVAVALGVGVAWGVANWQQQHSQLIVKAYEVPAGSSNSSQANASNLIAEKASQTGSALLTTLQQSKPEGTNASAGNATSASLQDDLSTQMTVESSGFRLAGKVALPREQVLNEAPANVQSYQYPNMSSALSTTASASASADPSYDDYLATSAALDETTRTQQPSVEDIAPQETSESEPIMLGANANRQGLATLEALREQVNAAAADVGLETAQSRKEDELVANFQDALKDVEYVKAAKTPVTEPKLDPIPKVENDDIPKYGQLPAGLQLQVPEFNIVAHVYSTDASQRWLNVDGAELQEGDQIGGKLKIIAIRPRDVVLEIQGTQFRVPAI